MPILPPLSAIRVFEAAARHENFSRAAEELALTQAGVSYQIKLLEERLGAQLFARKGRGIALTALGRRIAPRVTEAFAGLDEAFAMARAETEAVLTVTCSRTFASLFLASRIGDFHVLRPELAVRLDVTDRMVDLMAGDCDIAIRRTNKGEPGLARHFLMGQAILPMASPEFVDCHPVATPEDLLSVPRLTPEDEWWKFWFAGMGIALPPSADPAIRFDSQVLEAQAAIAGHGVAGLNPVYFREAIAAGQLVAALDFPVRDPFDFWLVFPEHKRNLAKVRQFRDWLTQSIREWLGDDSYGLLVPCEGVEQAGT